MLYLASWYLLAGLAFWLLGFETKGRSIEEIDRQLARPMPAEAKVASKPSAR